MGKFPSIICYCFYVNIKKLHHQKNKNKNKNKNYGGFKINILDFLTQFDILSHIYSKSDVMLQHFYNYFITNFK